MSTQTNKALIELGMTAWNAGEEAFANWTVEALAPTIKMHVPQGELTGGDVFRAYFHEIRGAFPDSRITVDELTVEGDTVVVRYTFSGANTGKLLTIPVTTGKQASFCVIDIWHLTNGKVVELWETYDRYGMLEQLGLVREQTVAVP
jgi:predicted ester cyclase